MLRDTVSKYANEVIKPKVKEMDRTNEADKNVLKSLFTQGINLISSLIYPQINFLPIL